MNKNAIRGMASAVANSKFSISGASQEMLSFIDKLELFGEKLMEEIKNGTAQLQDVAYYATRVVGEGARDIDLLKGDDKSANGICNFPDSQVPASRPFLLTAVMIEYSEAAAGAFASTKIISSLNAADFIMRYDGKAILDMGIQAFTRPDKDASNLDKTKGIIYNLANPKVLLGNKKVESVLKCAEAFPAPGVGLVHSVRFTMLGLGVLSSNV